MTKKKLPKGITFNKGTYEARAMIHGRMLRMYNKDLDKLLEEFESAKQDMRAELEYITGRMTLNEWFDEWFDKVQAKKIKPTSIAPMKNCFRRQIGKYIGERKLRDIRPIDIQNVINAADERGEVNSSTKEALSRLSKCFEYAVASGIVDRNPCPLVELPYEMRKTEEELPLTKEEERRFLDEAGTSWYKEMFFFMCLTGVRVGEVGGLSWKDIDFENKVINIRHSLTCQYLNGVKTMILNTPKTVNSIRQIPFLGDMEKILRSQKKKQRALRKELGEERWRGKDELSDMVFTTTYGSPCSRYIVQKEIDKIIERINEAETVKAVEENRCPSSFRNFHPHTLRHTFATRCFEDGIEPKVVQKLLGHSNISITLNIYTHVLEQKMGCEVEKLNTSVMSFKEAGYVRLGEKDRKDISVHSLL